jgi:hypothetical protein
VIGRRLFHFEDAQAFDLEIDTSRFSDFIGSDGGYYNCLPIHATRHLSAREIFLLTRIGIASVATRFAHSRCSHESPPATKD